MCVFLIPLSLSLSQLLSLMECLFVSPYFGFPSPLIHDVELQMLVSHQDLLANS